MINKETKTIAEQLADIEHNMYNRPHEPQAPTDCSLFKNANKKQSVVEMHLHDIHLADALFNWDKICDDHLADQKVKERMKRNPRS